MRNTTSTSYREAIPLVRRGGQTLQCPFGHPNSSQLSTQRANLKVLLFLLLVRKVNWAMSEAPGYSGYKCPIETDKQIQNKQKSPRECYELLTSMSLDVCGFLLFKSRAVLPAAQVSMWLNTLIYIFLFVALKKFKRLTPTSSRNLWELNKGRVLRSLT